MKNKVQKGIILFLVTTFLVSIDQISKYLITINFKLNDFIEIIPSFFKLHYIHNHGAAWGILQNKQWLFLIITIAVLIGAIYYYFKSEHLILSVTLILIISGGIGNLIDRIVYQYVVDFLDFTIFGYDFPIFNVADVLITVGMMGLLYSIYRKETYGNS